MSRVSGFNAQQKKPSTFAISMCWYRHRQDQGRHAFLSAGSWSCLKEGVHIDQF